MAPKEKKRKPATKKTDKPEEQVMSEKRHNMIAYLDPDGNFSELKKITQWIRESRINKAVTFSTPVYKLLIKDFWNSASVTEVDGTELIQGQVNQVNLNVSPDILNTVLELQDDPNAPYSVPIMCTRSCLLRMKCTGDIFSSQINKGDLSVRYKFLLHVLIQCISNRRAGYDMAGNDLVGLMVALVPNKPFSISKYIYANTKENMKRTGGHTTGNKFWIDDDGDDEGGDGDGGDAGAAGASSAGGDVEDSESDDNQPEPGYEFYLDERGVRKVRKIRLEDDDDEYVPSDTEAECLKRKQTATRRKKKARKNIGDSSVQQSVPQQEPIQKQI
ncbi:hypothetical protein HanRHA438_Chr15g0695961 [Helianthus annuus]|nr:hypothetical protein HanIR_Chr15g0742811 [Helianthus annuus]KAJ0843852.1 hypothetical protein HanRHA438_Chr15g0695961 [Helianthus annuus]